MSTALATVASAAPALAQPTDADLRALASMFPAMPRNSVDLFPFLQGVPTFGSGSPINDAFYTVLDTDYMDGENSGFDVFLPVDPSDAFPGSDTVKLIRCALNTDLDLTYGAARGDRIILGTAEIGQPFFMRGADGIDDDYAVILHLDYEHGAIQLRGQPTDYRLIYCTLADGCETEGWYLFSIAGDSPDLIAFVFPCDVIEPSVSGSPPNNSDPYCFGDGTLSLMNPNQFIFAAPIETSPAIPNALYQFGGSGKEITRSMAVDGLGNMYIVGATDSNLDGGVDRSHEVFVARLSPDGSTEWVTELALPEGSMLMDVAVDGQHVYAVGRTLGSLPGFQNAGQWDGIILKLDLATGELLETDQWGNSGIDGYGNIVLDGAGHMYISGQGSPDVPTPNDDAYLVAKHRTSDLDNIWRLVDSVPVSGFAASAEAWGGITLDRGTGPGTERLIVAGWYFASAGADAFVAAYEDITSASPTRSAFTTIRANGRRAEWVFDTAVDGNGRIYAAGYTTGSLDGPSLGQGDAFVIRFEADLSNPLGHQFGTPATDVASSIALSGTGEVIVAGYTHGDLAGQNNATGGMSADLFVQRFDADLTPLDGAQFGTPHEDQGRLFLRGDRLYLFGMTEGSVKSQSNGSFDAFGMLLDKQSFGVVPAELPYSFADIASPLGTLDSFDVIDVLARLDDMEPSTDLDGNGTIDFFDVLFLLEQVDLGCE
ncbi:MAG: SBBP repeat-containing protein [Phycisphaerales bacterium]